MKEPADANAEPRAFLGPDGEMSRLIAAHDWSDTLGPIPGWPQSLKAAVGLVVHSPVPMVLLWGEDGIMIYNDAYSVFAGGRHPRLLGSKVREGWPEVAAFNDNVMKVGLAGGALLYEDQELTLYRAGFPSLAHGPMPQDIMRDGGEAAVARALAWLTRRSPDSLEPGLDAGRAHAAFNITVLGLLLGTALEPDLADHLLLIEEVSEHMYRTDRAMFHLTGNSAIRKVAGIRLGRCNDIVENDPDFGQSEEEVVRYWCGRAGIPFLGRADIGHDSANHIVPFGLGGALT